MSAREQRKLAAIVAADLVGYSRLIGRDESGTVARLRRVRAERLEPIVGRHGGRLVKLTGDGALIEFASAVEALAASIEFQQAMAESEANRPDAERLVFRIGLHLGDVIVDGEDLYGDGVNVAARLEAEAPAGGILISGAIADATEGRLAAAFDDLGRLALKNIERPVQAYAVRWAASDWPVVPVAAPLPPGQGTAVATAQPSATATAPAAATALPLPDKPSIAVLPFQNMSGDPEQEYFVDGLVEDIITALSCDRGLFVTARNSSFTYKGRAVDIRQVGRDLGVRYVLEGSVRKAGGKVRITGQLIEAVTGSHLWADRFDGSLDDVFELQDQVANKVASIIRPAVEVAEIDRVTRKTADLHAYDLFLRAKAASYRTTPKDLDESLHFARQAVALDPSFARCHGLIAFIHNVRIVSAFSSEQSSEAVEAVSAAQRAMALDGNDATILMYYGMVLAQSLGRYDDGVALLDNALELDPNLAAAWTFRGIFKGGQGKIDEAISDLEHALRLSPRDPARWVAEHALAWAHLMAGRHDEASLWATRALQARPGTGYTLRVLIAAHALAGRHDKAREALATHLANEPRARLSTIRESYLRRVTLPAFNILADGLRKAGFPE